MDARNAFKTLNDLEFVNPNFIPNLSEMIRNAKLKGSSLVLIELINNVKQHTPDDEFVKYALAEFRVKMLQILNEQKF